MSNYSENTKEIRALAQMTRENGTFDLSDYSRYGVMRGLRDQNGKGVVAGLTQISEVTGMRTDEQGNRIPCRGQLRYRGYDIEELVNSAVREDRYGFEEAAYLLMFGALPSREELERFNGMLDEYRRLPTNFVRDVVLKSPSSDMMNTLEKCILTNASYDERPNEISLENVTRQCVQLLAKFPMFAAYGYQAYSYREGSTLVIHPAMAGQSTAETLLSLLRPDGAYTELEARILDLCLILHAEHGGGNNSAFTMHVVTSSGTDTYSAMAASLASLKGPRHGGANRKVVGMMRDMKAQLRGRWTDEGIEAYLNRILDKQAFDGAGLIYGMGHAVYSLSDPRAEILRSFAKKLSQEKGLEREYDLYFRTEQIASRLIARRRKIYKGVCANVDLYSGMVYEMLGIPEELFTPIFAVARCAGWSAHRLEEIINMGKIIRPAYQCVQPRREYVEINER